MYELKNMNIKKESLKTQEWNVPASHAEMQKIFIGLQGTACLSPADSGTAQNSHNPQKDKMVLLMISTDS